eukprot:TRINITY_DN223_c0_g1_i6.p1 TRINITY_DN223_c0_g1~~TRINITY_DN223_c0_g1_i6.p1  ORF type:complete len:333 (-),score=104.81 TRINITY_DN223_c0_g1_i6:29-1027(-)
MDDEESIAYVVYFDNKNEDDLFNFMIPESIGGNQKELRNYLMERLDLDYLPRIINKTTTHDEFGPLVEIIIKRGPYDDEEPVEEESTPPTSKITRDPSPEKRSPSPIRRSSSPEKRSPSPIRTRRTRDYSSPETKRSPSPEKRSPSPIRTRRTRDYSSPETRRSPSPEKRSPSPIRTRRTRDYSSPETKRSPSPKRRSPSPKIEIEETGKKVIKSKTLEEEIDEWESERKELNNLQDRRRQRRKELYQKYLSQQKEYKLYTEQLKQFESEKNIYTLYSLPRLLLIGVDQHDDDMRDLIEENINILNSCKDILEENRTLNKYEKFEPLDYLDI